MISLFSLFYLHLYLLIFPFSSSFNFVLLFFSCTKFTCFIANCWFIFDAKKRLFEMSQSWRLTNRFNFVFQWKILVSSWIFYSSFRFMHLAISISHNLPHSLTRSVSQALHLFHLIPSLLHISFFHYLFCLHFLRYVRFICRHALTLIRFMSLVQQTPKCVRIASSFVVLCVSMCLLFVGVAGILSMHCIRRTLLSRLVCSTTHTHTHTISYFLWFALLVLYSSRLPFLLQFFMHFFPCHSVYAFYRFKF